jgi:menaquinone-specific isochorismate synthase
VLARRKELHAEGEFFIESALARLSLAYPQCAVFAVDGGKSSFIGATPESLARVENGSLSLTCLAGSAARGGSPEEDRRLEQELFDSPKERREHHAVVSMAVTTLKDLCRELRWDETPRVLKLGNVQHLLTSVTGQVGSDRGILDFVKRLHPTPAVAGVPTERALSFIREVEGDRGWYAGPVGWIDHTGGGEFVVALRSALVRGDQAILYAGAGIVAGSEPDREFEETEMKFQPLLAALSGS